MPKRATTKRSPHGFGARGRAMLRGAASVVDLGATAKVKGRSAVIYSEALSLRRDMQAIGRDFQVATRRVAGNG